MKIISSIEAANGRLEKRLRELGEPAKKKLNLDVLIREGKEYAASCNYCLAELHCGACPNSCALSNVKCERGRELLEEVRQLSEK